MLGNEISDYQQLKCIKRKLETPEFWQKKLLLKSLYYCGCKVPVVAGRCGVALLANNKTGKFVGVSSCKSSWGCPVCTAREMAKYGERIACAIDALKAQGLSAAMLTFTIPHTSGFTCEQATEILYNVWKAFTVHGNKIQSTSKNDIFSNFMAEFQSKHRVRVCEYTWGNAGWHPHFHCLFWFPANRINEILDWENRLAERWLELCKRYTIKELLIGYPETQRRTVRELVTTRINIMYSKLNDVSKCVYISKSNNKVIVQESSQYITGWGGDKEITGNYKNKATAEGHYTWQQILENAIALDAAQVPGAAKPLDADIKDKMPAVDWWRLYFEYMEATRKKRHARINFSTQSGINKIVANWKKTETYKLFRKKKNIELQRQFGKWRVVCWFSKASWLKICDYDLEHEILARANSPNAFDEINQLLRSHQIEPAIQNIEATAELEAIYNAA